MSATEALKVARAAGIRLDLDGDDLVLEASALSAMGLLFPQRHPEGFLHVE